MKIRGTCCYTCGTCLNIWVSPDVSRAFHTQQSAGLQADADENGDSQAPFLLPASTMRLGSRIAALLEFGFWMHSGLEFGRIKLKREEAPVFEHFVLVFTPQ